MLKIVSEIYDLEELQRKFLGFFLRDIFDETEDDVDYNRISDFPFSSVEERLSDAGAELVFRLQRKVSNNLQERLKRQNIADIFSHLKYLSKEGFEG